MSYILEALKKSELERQQGRVPDLTSAPVAIGRAGAADTASLRPVLIAAVVLSVVAALLLWWRPWRTPELPSTVAPTVQVDAPPPAPIALVPRAAVEPAVTLPRAAPAPARADAEGRRMRQDAPTAVASAPTARMAPSIAEPKHAIREEAVAPSVKPPQRIKPVSPPAPPTVHSTPPLAPRAPRSAATPVSPESAPLPQSTPLATPTVKGESAAPAASNRVLNYSELPPAIQKSVARIEVAGYSYSDDPQARMVVINDRILHEGDEVIPGVRLDKIGSDGIVLNHKGIRFRP